MYVTSPTTAEPTAQFLNATHVNGSEPSEISVVLMMLAIVGVACLFAAQYVKECMKDVCRLATVT